MEQKFSDRIGATQPRRNFQIKSMDDSLRNALWNWVCWSLDKEERHSHSYVTEYWVKAAEGGLWDEVFHLRVDDIPQSLYIQGKVKEQFLNFEWFEVYNLIEWLLPRVNFLRGRNDGRFNPNPAEKLNRYLEREMSGYRAVNGKLVPVTSPTEVKEIEEAATRKKGFEGVAEHIETALGMLGKKPDPDYRNSVKESISAVEVAVNLLEGKSGGIEDALKILEKRGALHPAFKQALSKLYAYTSDKDGIRHALLEAGVTVTAPEAKFMLVACSAFANLLIDSSR